jgi:hypothetical protein
MSELHIYIAYKVIALEISNKTAELCMIFYLKHEFFIFLMYFKISYDFTILRSEFILHFPCCVKNAFLTTLIHALLKNKSLIKIIDSPMLKSLNIRGEITYRKVKETKEHKRVYCDCCLWSVILWMKLCIQWTYCGVFYNFCFCPCFFNFSVYIPNWTKNFSITIITSL